jgi:hypothetical protein
MTLEARCQPHRPLPRPRARRWAENALGALIGAAVGLCIALAVVTLWSGCMALIGGVR